MSERLKEPVLKTGNVKAFVSSNLTAVANAGRSGKLHKGQWVCSL